MVNAAQVKQILFGDNGVARHLKPGTVVMVSSTIASADAQEIATATAAFDLDMLDAPVSGGAIKAADGEMTVMASGSDNAFARLEPVPMLLQAKFTALVKNRPGCHGENNSPAFSGCTYCRRGRSNGTGRTRGHSTGCDV